MLNLIKVVNVPYLNNIIEITAKDVSSVGLESVKGTTATISDHEVWTQIKWGQVGDLSLPIWKRFYALAAHLYFIKTLR
ncbi:hypothetical protein [Photobacterium carnosum]|uniref:hypothetical protein n=1 Tax=Photobacterium carnosum TaxID=2023717 RepID=UPI001E48CCC6|nr:hypothetical protein [Photobacterium carnosum]MCD9496850.1 hypothetical protein [Photobacterium carnosum]